MVEWEGPLGFTRELELVVWLLASLRLVGWLARWLLTYGWVAREGTTVVD